MRNAVALVLGGGRGTRLSPLTSIRSKPAVPLGGMYRLIDIPISNCINSGINKIYVLTQFMSVSLHGHIRRAYTFDHFSGGFVELLAAQETANPGTDWYQGTADAVRKNIRYFDQASIDYVVILSGDQPLSDGLLGFDQDARGVRSGCHDFMHAGRSPRRLAGLAL